MRRAPGPWLLRSVGSRRRCFSPRAASLLLLVGWLFTCPPLFAQEVTPSPVDDQPRLGNTLSLELLRDLPTSENLFAVLEVVQPSLISDRFSGGGLYPGQPARIGGFLGSWTQTVYRLGDVDLTDPTGSGAPLLFPDIQLWQRVEVATGGLPADLNSPGLAITLQPPNPTDTWTGTLRGAVSHFARARTLRTTQAPSIARSEGWDHAAAVAGGPLIANRLRAVVGSTWTRGSQFNRDETSAVDADVHSLFGQLLFTPSDTDLIRTIGWVQRSQTPFEHRVPFRQPSRTTSNSSLHLQATWWHDVEGERSWRIFGGVSRRRRTSDELASAAGTPIFERLLDGPVAEIARRAHGLVDQWSLGTRTGPPRVERQKQRHTLQAGAEVGGGGARDTSFFAGSIGELVDGIPARVWRFAAPETASNRRTVTLALHVMDQLKVTPHVTIDGGLRFESASGSARGAASSIRWNSWLPRAGVRWVATHWWRTTLFARYSRSAYRLGLDLLATGDPGAPTADVFRWNGSAGSPTSETALGPLLARVGPGTTGDPAFSRIDPELRRPVVDELILGVEVTPRDGLRFGLVGTARRENDLIGLVNVGAPASAYSVSFVDDPGPDVLSLEDDRRVPIYNRLPSTFGADRYLLTNPGGDAATLAGLEVSARLTTSRLTLLAGATASIAEGSAANRGFGPGENDQSLVGELLVTPNAGTFARGRLFSDRAYTVKVAGVYRFPEDVRLGVIARYQDGQPFARLLVFPDLRQGAEAVRAFANGGTRFTFTGTLDVRLQKGFQIGAHRVDAIVDAYNLLNLSYEVEERTVAEPDVRVGSAVQPPRTFQIGARVTF